MTEDSEDDRIDLPDQLVDELTAVVRSTRQVFAAAACSCALATEGGDALRFVAADGAGASAIVGVTIPVSRGIAGWAALTGQAIAVSDVEKDARFARDVAESTEYVPHTILAAPIMSSEGEVSGVIEVLDPGRQDEESRLGEQRGTSAELTVLTLVSSQVSSVVRLTRGLDALQTGTLSPGTAGGHDAAALTASMQAVAATGPEGVRLARAVIGAVADYVQTRR